MRLIDADDIARELSGWDWQDCYLPSHFKELLLDEAKTIDPVHAAGGRYCRECKFHNKPRIGFCSVHLSRTNGDGFCGYGKKKE